MADGPPEVGPEQAPRRRTPPARLLLLAVVVAAVVILVVQNDQRVALRFLFVTGHVPLIAVMVVSLVVGGAIGFVGGARRARRRRRRREAH